MARERAILVVLVVLAALLSCAVEARRSRKLKGSNRRTDFDFFFLVRQWPATFCNDHYCTHRPPQKYAFTLHGFWPQRRDGTWPEYCDPSSHLRMDELDDLVDDMEHDWPSWSSADETFWDHEWSRHGTCAAPVTGGQHRFFKTVLALHHKLNLQDALSAAGIRPSNSKRYPVQDIKDAIEARYGVMPHVTCDGKGELSEVWMCVNKKLRMIDCVEDPRPPHAKAAAASQQQPGSADDGELSTAPVPANNNCNMVTIPKLQRHWGKYPDLQGAAAPPEEHGHHHHNHEHHQQAVEDDSAAAAVVDDEGADAADAEAGNDSEAQLAAEATAELAAVVQPLVMSAAGVVQELAAQGAAAADAAASEVSGVAASLAAVQQAAASVALSVVEAVAATADMAAAVTEDSAAAQADAAALLQEQAQQQPSSDAIAAVATAPAAAAADQAASVGMVVADSVMTQAPSLAAPNKHLPLLAGVVMGVVAAAVAAAAVALRAAPFSSAEGKGSCRVRGYMPPGAAVGSDVCHGEGMPLLAADASKV